MVHWQAGPASSDKESRLQESRSGITASACFNHTLSVSQQRSLSLVLANPPSKPSSQGSRSDESCSGQWWMHEDCVRDPASSMLFYRLPVLSPSPEDQGENSRQADHSLRTMACLGPQLKTAGWMSCQIVVSPHWSSSLLWQSNITAQLAYYREFQV